METHAYVDLSSLSLAPIPEALLSQARAKEQAALRRAGRTECKRLMLKLLMCLVCVLCAFIYGRIAFGRPAQAGKYRLVLENADIVCVLMISGAGVLAVLAYDNLRTLRQLRRWPERFNEEAGHVLLSEQIKRFNELIREWNRDVKDLKRTRENLGKREHLSLLYHVFSENRTELMRRLSA